MAGPDANGDGRLTAVETKPRDEYIADLRFAVTDAGGKPSKFHLIVPRALPAPFAVGERIKYRSNFTGGGPNARLSLLVHAEDGSLLLALDTPPQGWKIEQGKRTAVDRDPTSYDSYTHQVVFEHAGSRLAIDSGDWARLGEFYVWGNAVVRKRHTAKMPPDYVGSWLDFALVRAR
jgi:hypothetical protein